MIKIKRHSENGIQRIDMLDGVKKSKLSLKHLVQEFPAAIFSIMPRKDFKVINLIQLIFLNLVKESQKKFFWKWKIKTILFVDLLELLVGFYVF